jgi:hypothetical protein
MHLRIRIFGLTVLLAVATASMAKPPGLPIDPFADCKEPTPIAREFYTPIAPASPIEPAAGPKLNRFPMEPISIKHLVGEIWEAISATIAK